MTDNVNHPPHYASGNIEVIEAIEDWGFGPGFWRGNAIKYAARAGKKDPAKTIEDLEKAVWYLNREIEVLKAERDGREVVRPNDMNKRETQTGKLAVSVKQIKEALLALAQTKDTHFVFEGEVRQ